MVSLTESIAPLRDQLLSRREKRCSMNSQRIKEIVALLMNPIRSDPRRYFDTDLNALLEEYLTKAGLRALDAGDDANMEDVVAPNYAELALLLQQSAAIYGRKVDLLYQNVIEVSEMLHAHALYSDAAEEASAEGSAEEVAGGASPSAYASLRAEPFVRTGSQRDAALAERGAALAERDAAWAARDVHAALPHPTLPRVFMELEPRVLTGASHALRDYEGEIIGLLDDFHATLELSPSRMLVEHESAVTMDDEEPSLRPISLVELQQAIEAAMPPLVAPTSPLSPGSSMEPAAPLSPPGSSLEPASPLSPGSSLEPASPLSPGSSLEPASPLSPGSSLEPASPLSPGSALEPASPLSPGSSLEPASPLSPGSSLEPASPLSPGSSLEPDALDASDAGAPAAASAALELMLPPPSKRARKRRHSE